MKLLKTRALAMSGTTRQIQKARIARSLINVNRSDLSYIIQKKIKKSREPHFITAQQKRIGLKPSSPRPKKLNDPAGCPDGINGSPYRGVMC